MRSGDLTHRIALQRGTETRNSFGEPIAVWSDLSQVWAKIEWGGGSEGFAGDREYPGVPATISVRRSTDVMSLREKDRAFVPMAATKLRNAIGNSTATTMVLDAPGAFPPGTDFIVRVGSELVQVTAGAGTVASPYTITRGVYGTTAARHAAGDSAQHVVALDIVSVFHKPHSIELGAVRNEGRAP